TFYTPREIVTFMVKESLLQFLRNETNVTPEALKKFIYNMHLEDLSKSEIRLIDEKLENIKVLDPAVGSGAFPVEMLNILVSLRKKLDVRVGKNINEIELKKQFIRNNLYGVDIDSGAIEIAKLRLWLALRACNKIKFTFHPVLLISLALVKWCNSIVGLHHDNVY
ncbi:MAG: hypothetical protein COT09_00335, partial [Candidatus Hydromicrobium americanum]